MRKWLLIKDSEIMAGIIYPTTPDEDSGYNLDGVTVVEVEEFKPFDTYTFESGSWVEKLDAAKSAAISEINGSREQYQLVYLTPGDAKIFVYQQKANEVARADAATGPLVAEDFPVAKAQADLCGQTLEDVIDEFRQAHTACVTACAAIEAKARAAIKAIEDAQSIAEVQSVLTGVNFLDS